ncbi:MAG: aminotransferase class I/II-fold pyridoxal phosphate-dependent enzyme [Hespellia sp.]|nr:aminotransferase class I/II-fold pyridoxal phosphate-dependent enzyme [Hespellia sp.]
MNSLLDQLEEYSHSDFYGFHMPGHKRNVERFGAGLPYGIDITEIEGFDDLHHADGILKAAQAFASEVYHADETHFLINGSTCGLLSAIMGCTGKGEEILVARNCHKSIYHALYLKELTPVYLYPEFETELQLNGEVRAEDVRRELELHPEAKVVVVVSPTYDGVVSDISAIAEAAHEHGAVLIVDEAHGAHFGFHPYFPETASVLGADVVIHSLHKTLPALTQTALLHMNGKRVNRRRVKQYLDMLQTSSPSYVLMASMDRCIRLLGEPESCRMLFDGYVEMLGETREKLSHLKQLELLETAHFDRSKLVVSVKNVRAYSGRALYQELLERYHLQLEMASGSYALAMTTVGDTKEGMERLVKALFEVDARLALAGDADTDFGTHRKAVRSGSQQESGLQELANLRAETVCSIYEAGNRRYNGSGDETARLSYAESIGHISTEYAYVYPPGTPILVPGERVTEAVVSVLLAYRQMGFQIQGLEKSDTIEVWING